MIQPAIHTRLVPVIRSSVASPRPSLAAFPSARRTFRPRFSSSASAPIAPPPSSKQKRRPSVSLRSGLALLIGCGAIGGATYDYLHSSAADNKLGPLGFTPLTLTAIEHITPDTAIFTLALPAGMQIDDMALGGLSAREAIASVWVKQPELQIQRAYTPLEAEPCFAKTGEKGEMRLLVKRYRDGELSRWMFARRVGDEVGVRGPVLTWATPQVCDEVVFVSRHLHNSFR